MAPAGITAPTTPNTASFRDSVAASQMSSAAMLARTRPPTERERADLDQSRRQAEMVARRATTAGNGRDVHVPMGEGKDGVGAVGGAGGGMSIGMPLFSRGPSAAERKRNDSIFADYRARLARLQERARLQNGALRSDSLRRDSLARLAKRP
jgi:hypothetical protein